MSSLRGLGRVRWAQLAPTTTPHLRTTLLRRPRSLLLQLLRWLLRLRLLHLLAGAAAVAAAEAAAEATVAVVAATAAADPALVTAAGGGAAPRTLGAALLSTENMLLVGFMSVYNCTSSFYVETQIDQSDSRLDP